MMRIHLSALHSGAYAQTARSRIAVRFNIHPLMSLSITSRSASTSSPSPPPPHGPSSSRSRSSARARPRRSLISTRAWTDRRSILRERIRATHRVDHARVRRHDSLTRVTRDRRLRARARVRGEHCAVDSRARDSIRPRIVAGRIDDEHAHFSPRASDEGRRPIDRSVRNETVDIGRRFARARGGGDARERGGDARERDDDAGGGGAFDADGDVVVARNGASRGVREWGVVARARCRWSRGAGVGRARARWRDGAGGRRTAAETENAVTFADVGVGKHLARALERSGIVTPSIAQRAAMPAIERGENVAMQSHTGSGRRWAPLADYKRDDGRGARNDSRRRRYGRSCARRRAVAGVGDANRASG